MKKYFILGLLSCLSLNTNAQTTAAAYGFSAFSSTFTSISGTGTSTTSISSDDITSIYNIGFNFVYCGTTYTQAYVSSNGNIQLGTSCGSTVYYNDGGVSYLPCGGLGTLMPCFDDLWGVGHTCYYLTSGTAPNRVFTFEWNNWALYCCTGQHANFQVKLYETSNIIDFCYGTSSYSSNTSTIGIANSTTDYQTLPNHSTSPTPSSSTYTTSISGMPTSGQVYRWQGSCSGTPSAGTAASTVSVGCTSYSSVLSITGASSGAGITYQWQSSPDGTTWTNVTGATSITYTATISAHIYYRCVVTCTSTSVTATSTALELLYNAPPAAINGNLVVCQGFTSLLSDTSTGGTWSSSLPGTASITTGGLVTGGSSGTTTISYTVTGAGCYTTVTVTVNPSPSAILGAPAGVCQGNTLTLSDITPGGSWSSSFPAYATIGSSTGLVTGIGSGVTTISYTVASTGCSALAAITANPTPAPIAGITSMCLGLTDTLIDASGTGTWTSLNPGIASINPGTGVGLGNTVGTTTITFTLPTTCFTTLIVTVNPLPTAILGRDTVCEGSTVLLSDMTGGGTWSSGLSGTASIGSSTGLVTGVSSGSAPVTYTVNASGCIATANVWVNPLPALISGQNYACAAGSSTSLSDATGGGTWSSSDTSVAVVSTSGLVTSSTSGVTIITYSLPTGCLRTDVVTINPLPSNIYGPDSVCFGYTTVVMDSTSGGYFTSSAPGIATVDSFTGAVHGLGVGTTMISYTASGTGCTNPRAFTVNPILTVGLSIASLSGTTVCADDIVTFITNPVNGGTSPVYQWKVNGVNSGSGTTFTLNPHNLDSVSCVMTSNGVCAIPSTTSAYLIMTVNPLVNPILNMSTSYPDDTLCIGKRDSFWVSSTYGGTSPVYQWSVNWVSVLTGSTSFAYTPANGDIVTCKMTSSSPCPRPDTVDATAVLVVQDYHIPTVAITSSDGTDICQGNRVNIVPTSTWGGWTPAFHWSLNGSNLGILPGYSYYPSNGDTIECTMISNYRCTMPNDTAVVKMGFVVEPVIQVHISGRSLIMYGQSDTLHANVINGGSSPTYQWGINGSPVGGATGSTFITPYLTNFDSVYCIVTTHGGACDGVAAFNWIIMEVGRTSISQVNSSINELQLIPNPNKGMFTVKGMISGDVETVEMTICDVVGQVVYKGNAEVKAGKLDKDIQLGTNLADGMYLLNMKTGTEKQVIRFSVNR